MSPSLPPPHLLAHLRPHPCPLHLGRALPMRSPQRRLRLPRCPPPLGRPRRKRGGGKWPEECAKYLPERKKRIERNRKPNIFQCSDAALPSMINYKSHSTINPLINSLITYPRSCPTLATVGRWGQRHASMRTRRSHREYPPRPVPRNLEGERGRQKKHERERRERRNR